MKDFRERSKASKAAMEKFKQKNNNDSGSSSRSHQRPPQPLQKQLTEPDPVIEDITPDTTIITDPPAKLTPDTPLRIGPENTGATEGSGAPDEQYGCWHNNSAGC